LRVVKEAKGGVNVDYSRFGFFCSKIIYLTSIENGVDTRVCPIFYYVEIHYLRSP